MKLGRFTCITLHVSKSSGYFNNIQRWLWPTVTWYAYIDNANNGNLRHFRMNHTIYCVLSFPIIIRNLTGCNWLRKIFRQMLRTRVHPCISAAIISHVMQYVQCKTIFCKNLRKSQVVVATTTCVVRTIHLRISYLYVIVACSWSDKS